MECFGAVKDTLRLLGDGVASLARYWSKLGRGSLIELAARWNLPHLSAKSTKGAFTINWRDQDARAKVIDRLAQVQGTVPVEGFANYHIDLTARGGSPWSLPPGGTSSTHS